MARITIDPFTRIEGHLRIDVEIEGGKVKDAWTTGTLFRGFEIILQGRGPAGCLAYNTANLRGLPDITRPYLVNEHGRCFQGEAARQRPDHQKHH